MGLSVVIITKNEENDIEGCLESIKWANEIVVVDAFSEDATCEICRRYTDKVYQRTWEGYAPQKNFGNSQCTHDWILSIDADERVSAPLAEEIKQAIGSSSCVAYRINCRDFMFGKWIEYGCWRNQWPIRLFKKADAVWQGVVHEKLVVSGAVGQLIGPLQHFAHTSIAEFMEKQNLYTTIEARQWYEQGVRASWGAIVFFTLRSWVGQYIWLQGWRDGGHGLILAALTASYNFLARVKLWELWYKCDHGVLESKT